jgi:hypothetical protein
MLGLRGTFRDSFERKIPSLQIASLGIVVGTSQADPGLDADDAAGEIGQDWGQGGVARQEQGFPTGGGGSVSGVVRGTSETDRLVAAGDSLEVRLAVTDKAG